MAKRVGRPRKSKSGKARTDKLEIRLTPEEKQILKNAADRLGYSGITELVRDQILEFATRLETEGYSVSVAEEELESATGNIIDRVSLAMVEDWQDQD